MKRVLLIIMTVALMTSCYLSELSDTTHPDMGMVVVNKLMPDDVAPPADGFTIVFNGQTYTSFSTITTIDALLEPGVYTLYVYNNLSDMSIDHDVDVWGEGTIISSKTIEAGMVESLTDDLYFGTETITVLADEIIYSDVLLKQETRDILFNLQITEGDPDRIASVTASLGGIAGQWECIDDVPIGDAVTICPAFSQGESLTKADANDYLTSSIKVLGINGDEQELILKITYIDGTTQTVTSPLGDELTGSNDTKSTPIILSGTLTTPIAGSLEGATIDNWTQINGGSETVN